MAAPRRAESRRFRERERLLSSPKNRAFIRKYGPLVRAMVAEAIEDWIDVRESEEALKEGPPIPHDRFWKRLGL